MRAIDTHTHLGKWFFPIEKVSVEDFVEVMENQGIEASIVSSTRAICHDFQIGNREVAEAIRGRENLFGLVFLNPNYISESFEEMARHLGDDRFVGLGELYHRGYIGTQTIDCEGHRRFLDRLLERHRQRLVLFHCPGDGIERVLALAVEFPDLTFIAGHMGGDDYERAAVRFREVDNVYLEICSSSPDRGKIETVVRDIGSERVVFGSDSTLLNPAVLLGMVVDSEISEEDKVRILYSNARGFLER